MQACMNISGNAQLQVQRTCVTTNTFTSKINGKKGSVATSSNSLLPDALQLLLCLYNNKQFLIGAKVIVRSGEITQQICS